MMPQHFMIFDKSRHYGIDVDYDAHTGKVLYAEIICESDLSGHGC